jgi:protein phosphatase
MGGHAAGDVASSVAIAALAPLDDDVPPSDLLEALERALNEANDQLRQMVSADDALDGMGTTVTAMLCAGQRLALAHVGDSRAYLLRNGELQRITHDHTLVQALIDDGQLSEFEAATHPQRSVLMRVLDGRSEIELDLSVRDARAGDRYLLCSDGLSGVVRDDTLRETLATREDPQHAVDALVDLALRGGGPDNITCIVADIVEAEPGADRSSEGKEPVVGGSVPNLEHVRERRRGWRGPVLVVLIIAALAGALLGGTWWYAQHQFYVGSDDGQVVIYRGIKGSIAGISFSSVEQRTGILLDELPSFERDKVVASIDADSLNDAKQIVDRLRTETTSGSEIP